MFCINPKNAFLIYKCSIFPFLYQNYYDEKCRSLNFPHNLRQLLIFSSITGRLEKWRQERMIIPNKYSSSFCQPSRILANNSINQPVQICKITSQFVCRLIPTLMHEHNTLLNRVLVYQHLWALQNLSSEFSLMYSSTTRRRGYQN